MDVHSCINHHTHWSKYVAVTTIEARHERPDLQEQYTDYPVLHTLTTRNVADNRLPRFRIFTVTLCGVLIDV